MSIKFVSCLESKHRQFEIAIIKYLKVHGLWRGKLPEAKTLTAGRVYTIFLTIWFLLMIIGDLMYFNKYNDGDMYAMAGLITEVFIILIMEFYFIMCQTKIFQDLLERYYQKIHLSTYKYHDVVSMQVLRTTEDTCLLVYRTVKWLSILAPLSYEMVPVLINITSGAFRDHSIPLETTQHVLLPFEYRFNIVNWIFSIAIFTLNSFTICSFVLHFLMFMLCIVIHLLGNVEIVKHNLQSFSKMVDKNKIKFSKEEDDYIFEHIKRTIDDHNSVLVSLDILKQFYGIALFCAVVYDFTAICILMLVLLKNPMNFIRYGSVAAVVFLQLIGISYAFEMLGTAVEELQEAIAAVPWYAMSKRNQRAVNIMIIVSQRPFIFKVLHIYTVNLRAMAAILKTCFSYFLWLNSMSNEGQQ